jgi:hypothetical protein
MSGGLRDVLMRVLTSTRRYPPLITFSTHFNVLVRVLDPKGTVQIINYLCATFRVEDPHL